MTFISYAQNLEDVMLWRALGHIEQGFYIDIGAFSPENDSVTCAFYQRGWSGVNVEPNPIMFAELQRQRPRDINLQAAISTTQHSLELNLISDIPGLTTLAPEYAEKYRLEGHSVEKITVPGLPLTTLWKHHAAGRQVHFLKIDVEGAEKDVIESNDWSANRPWALVIEATTPNSPQPTYAAWDPLLTQANYHLVYFDGLNRFYLAQEHLDLSPAFQAPPNVFDDFKPVTQQRLEEMCRVLDEKHQALAQQIQTIHQDYRALEEQSRAALQTQAAEIARLQNRSGRQLLTAALQKALDRFHR